MSNFWGVVDSQSKKNREVFGVKILCHIWKLNDHIDPYFNPDEISLQSLLRTLVRTNLLGSVTYP